MLQQKNKQLREQRAVIDRQKSALKQLEIDLTTKEKLLEGFADATAKFVKVEEAYEAAKRVQSELLQLSVLEVKQLKDRLEALEARRVAEAKSTVSFVKALKTDMQQLITSLGNGSITVEDFALASMTLLDFDDAADKQAKK